MCLAVGVHVAASRCTLESHLPQCVKGKYLMLYKSNRVLYI